MIHQAIEEQIFLEVVDEWNLQLLYQKLADVKQINVSRKTKLSPVEKAMLRGLLAGYSPKQIAQELHWTSASVGVELSKGLYRYVETVTERKSNSLHSWRDIAKWLEEAGYKTRVKTHQLLVSGDELPEATPLYGRELELNQLQQWLIRDRYRLVLVSGMIGIGKTTLAAHLARTIKGDFEYIIWHNLKYQPSLSNTLVEILDGLAPDKTHDDPAIDINAQITQLLEYFRQHRCLLILDGLEATMSDKCFAGFYRREHQAYSQLIARVAVENHQSCLLITSRDEPVDMPLVKGNKADIFNLQGLGKAGTDIFRDYNLSSLEMCHQLLDSYSGNPLVLKLISAIIQDLFNGDILSFLAASNGREINFFPLYFKKVIEERLERLPELEMKFLCCLAKYDPPLCFEYLQENLALENKISNFLQVLNSLKRRSFLEMFSKNNKTYFALPKIIQKSILNRYQGNYHLLTI